MNNEIVYEINENNHLILKSIFNGLEIGTVDGGDIEEILHKVKMYNEEYDNLMNQNRLMIEIHKDYKEKDKEIERLNNIINELESYIKHYDKIEGYYEYVECGYDEYNSDEDVKEQILDYIKELKEGK